MEEKVSRAIISFLRQKKLKLGLLIVVLPIYVRPKLLILNMGERTQN
jgi:hypothetical protein